MVKVLILEDEDAAAIRLQKMVAELMPEAEFLATIASVKQGIEWLKAHALPQLIFADIQLNDGTSFDIFKEVEVNSPVIFTTAYRKFAIEGFELDAVDYLLKPISFERFLKAVNKVMETSLQTETPGTKEIAKNGINLLDGFISLRADRKNLKIAIADILYIESLKDYIKVVTKDKTIITKQSISSFEENLPENFIRIHRSFIVAVNKIESYTNELIQIGKYELPISRSYRHEVEKALKI